MIDTTATPVGRLVIVLEKRLSSASRKALHDLLGTLMLHPDITFVAGLGKAAMVSAGHLGPNIFYNTNEHIPLGEVAPLVPWREIWLVSAGRVWRTAPSFSANDTPLLEARPESVKCRRQDRRPRQARFLH